MYMPVLLFGNYPCIFNQEFIRNSSISVIFRHVSYMSLWDGGGSEFGGEMCGACRGFSLLSSAC